ncbi:MAG: hypothetical protein LBN26_06435 [Christensenellaceae bacterium]|jgi:hypothetical protein|nr:hypothetical protein [Christensenellaceae bacterium]
MKLKRIFTLVLAITLLASFAPNALAAEDKYSQDTGTITAVDTENKKIEVTLADGSTWVFNYNADTTFLSAEDGSVISAASLKAGQRFTAWRSTIATRSLPPQSFLYTMIVTLEDGKDYANAFAVGSVADGGNRLTNQAGDLILNLANADILALGEKGLTKLKASSIKAGAQVIAWYSIVAQSMPAQASPAKVLVITTGSGSVHMPKTGAPLQMSLAISALVLSAAGLGTVIFNMRHDKKED